ncbi:phosphopantothenoylcysteine decarboxylase / phosphopantothenate-cysteine ligase [Ligilactobacillus salitolerans]|uniref:Coenzyme A biosynthesis bifunctional protein CoaBC n=1 Tax=Ligilactobacillus salitolerans TaxID=1808352 RepID=A0A401IRF7_9LACO|nr:bifunctional phosphopantothenoylcysteine decarboxylase/phosphopantothenate--cysteine ligase CoaBC [Ligilactobacillus salitolerans]GBG94119.1 phosphopantothenoylcysteine decarboxylase / phosphopantothenate-cysteine ligase [Ligilactobacillus salitolerans]
MSTKHVVIYITGGIAVYKAAQLVREFVKAGAQVKVAMTDAAQTFVSPQTFAVLTKNPVYTDFSANQQREFVSHIELADWTDIAVVVPATANIIAKMALGIADTFVSTALLATAAPKYVIPAMNEKMWQNAATKRNLATLKNDGIAVMEPAEGFLAEGYSGKGRMPEPLDIFKWINNLSAEKQDLAGRKVLISAGPTVEPIDPVRYLSNHSSGKMGYALANAAAKRGAEVTLVSGPTRLTKPAGVKFIQIQAAAELQETMEKNFSKSDIVIMAAAVSDYHVDQVAPQKIKKNGQDLELHLVSNPDILAGLGQIKKGQILVGFAAETENLLANGNKKLQKKNLDLLVLNDVSRTDIGFNAEDNEVRLLRARREPRLIAKSSKDQIANQIFDEILNLA